MNLYRIHYTHHNGSEIDYYDENQYSRFKADLLRHSLDVERENSGRDWTRLITASYWREAMFGKDDDILRRAKRIIKVETVRNDEWVPVEYEFIRPEVIIK